MPVAYSFIEQEIWLQTMAIFQEVPPIPNYNVRTHLLLKDAWLATEFTTSVEFLVSGQPKTIAVENSARSSKFFRLARWQFP